MSMRRSLRNQFRNPILVSAVLLACGWTLGLTWLGGCARNDPFDPESLENIRPTIAFFVTPADTTEGLSSTSYSEQEFRWSGTDPDGWVEEYYVAIDTSLAFEAVWDTTTRTDTTITFSPDIEGNADVTFSVACRDNRGAYSDTIVQFIPMHNFPPVVEFQSDFDPLTNMQREFLDADGNVIQDGSAAADTVFWNWGPGNFRVQTYDLDGSATMEPFYRYTLADVLPDSTYDLGDERADPETTWVRAYYESDVQLRKFNIFIKSVLPGPARTLSVSVKDTVGSGPIHQYTWEVRAPKGPVLYIPDSSAPQTREFYETYLDSRYGEGNWDSYTFWKGFPDEEFTLLESLRKFELVLWTDTGTASNNIRAASAGGGILEQYLVPLDGSEPKKIFLISKILTGARTGLSNPFRENILGINIKGSPEAPLAMPVGPQALGLQSYLPVMSSLREATEGGIGLQLHLNGEGNAQSEFLYQMEDCGECYGTPRRPANPSDPFVAVRSVVPPIEDSLADIVGISLQLDDFDPDEVYPALDAILEFELGVITP